jgi:molecular chaperone GrpE
MSRVILVLLACAASVCDGSVAMRTSRMGVAQRSASMVRTARIAACAPAEEEEEPTTIDDDAPADGDSLLSSPAFLKKKIEMLESEMTMLQQANADLEARLADEVNTPQVLRLQADFENFRRRTAEQSLEQKKTNTADCVKQLLPVIDNFDRAAMLKLTTEEGTKIQNSYNQLYKQLLKVVTDNFGAVEIEAVGKPFDFNAHEAIVRAASDEYEEGLVVDVLQRGYMIGDKLVRPAGVRVSAGPGPGGAAPASE